MPKPTVLIIADYAPPSQHGGAVRSLVTVLDALKDEIDFKILTRNFDPLTGDVLEGVVSDRWSVEDGVSYLRLSRANLSIRKIRRAVLDAAPASIYVNSLFSRLTQRLLLLRSIGALTRFKLVIVPEGELDPGALAVKPVRKKLWLLGERLVRSCDKAVWKAASEPERNAILRIFPSAKVAVAANLPSNRTLPAARPPKKPGEVRLLFLSRISPKKNLEFLIKLLGRAPGNTSLTIVGPVDDTAYFERCRQSLSALPPTVKAEYLGPCMPGEVWRYYAENHAFVLPTLGENHGFVIEDAIAAGCVPIISDRTPWSFIADTGAGYVLPVETETPWVEAIGDLWAADNDRYAKMAQACREIALNPTDFGKAVDRYRRLFLES